MSLSTKCIHRGCEFPTNGTSLPVRFACHAAALAGLLGAPAVNAAEPINVESRDCDLRQGELERLVRLELGSVVNPGDQVGYQVVVACEKEGLYIRIEDPLTQKALERLVKLPEPESPEPERVVALSVAQLYRAAWLELLAEDPPPLAPSKPVPPAPRAKIAARAKADAVLPRRSPRTSRAALRLATTARGMTHNTLVLPVVGVGMGWSPWQRWWLDINGQFEAGAEDRATGRVEARFAGGHVGASFEPSLGGSLSGVLAGEAGLLLMSLRGRNVGPGMETGNIEGMVVDGSAGAGVAVQVERMRIALLGRVGMVIGGPVGYVQGDDAVDLNGPWLGAFVDAGASF